MMNLRELIRDEKDTVHEFLNNPLRLTSINRGYSVCIPKSDMDSYCSILKYLWNQHASKAVEPDMFVAVPIATFSLIVAESSTDNVQMPYRFFGINHITGFAGLRFYNEFA